MTHFAEAGYQTPDRYIDGDLPAYTSPTAYICDNAALYGATPGHDEIDNRFVWERDEALAALGEAIRIIAHGVTATGTQLADERESLIWGIVNTLENQRARLSREIDQLTRSRSETSRPETIEDLKRAQDGTEITAHALETKTYRARILGDRSDAFEQMRDFAADAYNVETGKTWRPRNRSHVSRTGTLTAASIDARDFIRARKERETNAHLPTGTLIAFAGGKDYNDIDAIHRILDMAHAKHADMILVHGGAKGAETIAAAWADSKGVNQIVSQPDWKRHAKAAPFRRNDEMLKLLPIGLIATPGSGITDNLVDKAREMGIPVHQLNAD